MQRSRIPYLFLALAAILATTALVMLMLRPGAEPPLWPPESATDDGAGSDPLPAAPIPVDDSPIPETSLDTLGLGLAASTQEELIDQIAKAIQVGDFTQLSKIIGKEALDPENAERLRALIQSSQPEFRAGIINEVGEIELNTRTRWAIPLGLSESGNDRILLDLKRSDGKWSVEKITLPSPKGEALAAGELPDSLHVADAFLQAVLQQDLIAARKFADISGISNAKIAGLCILFEEGGYRMRQTKRLRPMFQRPDMAGYLANVENQAGKQSAQFSMRLHRPQPAAGWMIVEINLDQMLTEYSQRVAGGNIYYSPLVKNPAGGETLALYFEFDEDDMNPRARRQLEIVSMILKSDTSKKITLSGHTDALGTETYNNSLSARRAEVVREFLAQSGVDASQIITIAKGASQPRRPNVTETGQDDPEGRQANRRTEVYLDF